MVNGVGWRQSEIMDFTVRPAFGRPEPHAVGEAGISSCSAAAIDALSVCR